MTGDHTASTPRHALALEPLEDETPATAASVDKPARFYPNTRAGGDRRSGTDRRETIRFEADRRSRRDRRPRRTWENGHNL